MAKSNFKRCLCLGAVLLLGGCLSFGAAALTEEAPYYSYRYDHWGSPVETAQTYLPEAVLSGESLGCGAMKLPTDLAVTSDNRVYILDSGNSRVLVLDDSLQLQDTLLPTDEAGEPLALSEPSSLFISEKFGQILIADKKAGVLVFDASLRLIRTLGCPDSPVLPDDFLFAPVSALVDSAGITYVISSNCYQGALQYDEHGRFLGFYGSEKVTLTLETMLNQFWKSMRCSPITKRWPTAARCAGPPTPSAGCRPSLPRCIRPRGSRSLMPLYRLPKPRWAASPRYRRSGWKTNSPTGPTPRDSSDSKTPRPPV